MAFVVSDGTPGDDFIPGSGGEDVINGGSGNDILQGLGGNDVLYGGAGDDLLDGGAGVDVMFGGTGNDKYIVDNVGDILVELENEGTDTVYSYIDYTLRDNFENLVLWGAAANGTGNSLDNIITGNSLDNTLDGGAGNDKLLGGAGNDHLIGGLGNDLLDGGTGADLLEGGDGNDLYYVDNAGDRIVDSSGDDTIVSSVDYDLYNSATGVEHLFLTGNAISAWGNQLDNDIRGNAQDNFLYGGSGSDWLVGNGGNDVLSGGQGIDHMAGGEGNDSYIVDNSADVVTERAGQGIDHVYSSADTYSLTDNVEQLSLRDSAYEGIGNALDNEISGTDLNNRLIGGAGDDTLWGLGGDDILIGGAGRDTLGGGAGSDRFVFNTAATIGQADTILDFEVGVDKLAFDKAFYSASSNFSTSVAATGSAPTFLYQAGSGILAYDKDGAGGAAAIEVAHFTNHANLSADDFMFV